MVYFGYGTRLPAYRAVDNHVYDRVRAFLHLRRDHRPAAQYRAARTQAFQTWAEVTGVAATA